MIGQDTFPAIRFFMVELKVWLNKGHGIAGSECSLNTGMPISCKCSCHQRLWGCWCSIVYQESRIKNQLSSSRRHRSSPWSEPCKWRLHMTPCLNRAGSHEETIGLFSGFWSKLQHMVATWPPHFFVKCHSVIVSRSKTDKWSIATPKLYAIQSRHAVCTLFDIWLPSWASCTDVTKSAWLLIQSWCINVSWDVWHRMEHLMPMWQSLCRRGASEQLEEFAGQRAT